MIRQLCILLLFLTLSRNLAYANVTIILDEELDSVLHEISDPIFKAAGLNPRIMKFYLIQDEDINAFVTGGSNIFINTGLISFSSNPEVIAGVIAHETGHLVGHHVALRDETAKSTNAKIALSVLAGIAAGAASNSTDVAVGAFALGEHLSIGSFLKFTRAQESSADQTAIRLLRKTGISPNGLSIIMKHFVKRDRASGISSGDIYYRTHPMSQDRLYIIENAIKTWKPQGKGISESLKNRYAIASAKIIAFTGTANDVLTQYKLDHSTAGKYAKAIATMKAGKLDQAITMLNELIQNEPENPFFHELLAQMYNQNKQMQKAVNEFEIAIKLRPHSLILLQEYADTILHNKDGSIYKAIQLLERILDIDENNANAHRLLSGAYNKLNDKQNAQLYMAYYYYDIKEIDKAKSIFKHLDENFKDSIKARDLKALLS